MNINSVFTLNVEDTAEASLLKQRWHELEFKSFLEDLRASILLGGEIPENPPLIYVNVMGKRIQLVDLRGIVLSSLDFGEVDLSYCCFDEADLSFSKFNRTKLQYSSFKNSNFLRSIFNNVQASPIYAQYANFNDASFINSYFMHSDFANSDLRLEFITNTAFVGSSFLNVKKSYFTNVLNVDLTDAHFANSLFPEYKLQNSGSGPSIKNEIQEIQQKNVRFFGKNKIYPRKSGNDRKYSSLSLYGQLGGYFTAEVSSVNSNPYGNVVIAKVGVQKGKASRTVLKGRENTTLVHLKGEQKRVVWTVGEMVDITVGEKLSAGKVVMVISQKNHLDDVEAETYRISNPKQLAAFLRSNPSANKR